MQQDKSEQAKLIQEIYDIDRKNHVKQFTEAELRKAFRAGHAVGVYVADYMTDELEDKFVNDLLRDRNEEELLLRNDNHSEISDEDIYKAAYKNAYESKIDETNVLSFMDGVKWYKEQLNKNNG